MRRYDKTHPDPRYHAEWSRRYANRAAFLAKVSMGLALISVALVLLRAFGVLS